MRMRWTVCGLLLSLMSYPESKGSLFVKCVLALLANISFELANIKILLSDRRLVLVVQI